MGIQDDTDHTPGSRREESLRARSGFAVRRRAPTAVGGRSQARRCTCAALSWDAVNGRGAGLPVTQCRPWLAEAVWSEARAAPAMRPGAGKRAQRFHAASSFRVIRDVLRSIGASVRLADVVQQHPLLAAGASAARVGAETVFRLAEVGLGQPRPALRRQR